MARTTVPERTNGTVEAGAPAAVTSSKAKRSRRKKKQDSEKEVVPFVSAERIVPLLRLPLFRLQLRQRRPLARVRYQLLLGMRKLHLSIQLVRRSSSLASPRARTWRAP